MVPPLITLVIGFYFGSRTATSRDGTAAAEAERMRQQRNDAVAEKDEGKAAELLKKVRKTITLDKTV